MKNIKDEGLVTQLAVVATMLPKVKKLIDDQQAEIEALKTKYQQEFEYAENLIKEKNEPIK